MTAVTRTIASRRQRGGTGRFVGRAREQELLRATLRQLAALRDRRDDDLADDDLTYAQVFLVAAEGGMGKTTLLRRFQEIIAENKEQAGATALYLDFERHTLIPDSDRLMSVLHDALCEAGFEHEMQPYRDALAQRAEARRKAADAEERYKSQVHLGGRAVQLPTNDGIDNEMVLGGTAVDARVLAMLREFIAKKLDADEWKLYDDPEAITEEFMQALNCIAAPRRPLVLLLDTYELAEGCDNWLRKRAIPLSGPRLVWVIAGREGQPFIRRYEDEFGTGLVARLLLDTFARPDVTVYLRQWGIPSPSDDLIDQLQVLSRGVPLALEGWVNLYQHDVALPPADLAAPTTRREIVRHVTERFLRYCEDDKHLPDQQRRLRAETRFRVLTLMLPRRTDNHALAAAWQCSAEQAEERVNALADQFSFVFAQEIEREPHALAKEFLREYLRDQARLPVVIESAVTRILEHFEQRKRKREQALTPGPAPADVTYDDERAALLAERDAHQRRLEQLDIQLAGYGLAAPPHIRTDRDQAAAAIKAIDAQLATSSGKMITTPGPRRPLWVDDDWREALLDLLNALCWADRSGERTLRVLVPMFVEALEFSFPNVVDLLRTVEEFSSHWAQEQRRLFKILADGHREDAVERKKGVKTRALVDALQPAVDHWNLTSVQHAILDLQRARMLLNLDIGSKSENLASALITTDEAARKLPMDGGELAESLADLYYSIGCNYLWPKHHHAVVSHQAAYALKIATQFAPQNLHGWYALGMSYMELGKDDVAIITFQQVIKIDPSYTFPHNGLGVLYARNQRYDESIAAFKQALTLDPTFDRPYRNLGTVYSMLNRIDEAYKAYHRAVVLDPKDYQSMICLARLARQLNDQDQLISYINQARALLPTDDFYNIACLESIAGNAEMAIEALRSALEHREEHVEWAREDPDFVFIREDPRYRALVGLEPLAIDEPPASNDEP